MAALLAVALMLGLIVAVCVYCESGEEDSHLRIRLQAQIERFERYKRSPKRVLEMSSFDFRECIAGLCCRDGCTDVQWISVNGLGGVVIGSLPDGRKAVVQCMRENGDGLVDSRHIRMTYDAVRAQLDAEVTILVVLGPPLSRHVRKVAARCRLTLIDVDRLESWMRGATLSALLEPDTGLWRINRKSAYDD